LALLALIFILAECGSLFNVAVLSNKLLEFQKEIEVSIGLAIPVDGKPPIMRVDG